MNNRLDAFIDIIADIEDELPKGTCGDCRWYCMVLWRIKKVCRVHDFDQEVRPCETCDYWEAR